MVRVGIIGGSGYTGVQLVALLASHPGAEVVWVTSRKLAGRPVWETFGALRGVTDLAFRDYGPDLLEETDVVFTAVPHGEAMEIVAGIAGTGCRVIDLSADFRFRDVELYEKAYTKHLAPDLAREAVYGLPELFADAIRGGRLVGNPGCYPTSAILAAAPALVHHLQEPGRPLIVDAKSGVSGAGRGLNLTTHFCEVDEGLMPYKVLAHRHQPEIASILQSQGEGVGEIYFIPHLVPMNRGIIATVYIPLRNEIKRGEIQDLYRDFYRGAPFVRILSEGHYPSTHYVRGSNYCDIGLALSQDGKLLVAMSAIDNLIKGASGQAVQNMNLMMGMEETLGLKMLPLFP